MILLGLETYLKTTGVTLESNYPYRGWSMKCKTKINGTTNDVIKIQNYTKIMLNGDEQKLKELVTNVGPIVVGVHVSRLFKMYHRGIFEDTDCMKIPNHAVLVVNI